MLSTLVSHTHIHGDVYFDIHLSYPCPSVVRAFATQPCVTPYFGDFCFGTCIHDTFTTSSAAQRTVLGAHSIQWHNLMARNRQETVNGQVDNLARNLLHVGAGYTIWCCSADLTCIHWQNFHLGAAFPSQVPMYQMSLRLNFVL
jgi:hypothetical protein